MSESSIRQFIEKSYPKYYSTETYPASECVRIHKITEPWSPTNINDAIKALVVAINDERDKRHNGMSTKLTLTICCNSTN